jgi:predicted RNase H-like HicB family nuclease
MGYTVVLEKDDVDGGLVVYVPVLRGCVSQGDTREEALANIREAAELYIERYVRDGDAVLAKDPIELVEVEIDAPGGPC